MGSNKKRLAIAGCGFLGNIVMDGWCNGLLPEYEIVGVLGPGKSPGHGRQGRLSGV